LGAVENEIRVDLNKLSGITADKIKEQVDVISNDLLSGSVEEIEETNNRHIYFKVMDIRSYGMTLTGFLLSPAMTDVLKDRDTSFNLISCYGYLISKLPEVYLREPQPGDYLYNLR